MSLTWEHIPKNAEDPETIEQAIQRIIQEHNNDSESHLLEGQSLQSHKASEIIDHLAESIIADKLANDSVTESALANDSVSSDKIQDDSIIDQKVKLFDLGRDKIKFKGLYVRPSFDASDNWTIHWGSGSISTEIGSLRIATPSKTDDYNLTVSLSGIIPLAFGTKKIHYGSVHRMNSTANVEAWFGIGNGVEFDPLEKRFIGFRYDSANKLYAVWVNSGAESSQQIACPTMTNINEFNWLYSPGEKIEFFVNDMLLHTATTNLPTASPPDVFFMYYLRNKTNSFRTFEIIDLSFVQDR